MCDRWRLSFDHFLADMGVKPDGVMLERVNTDGDYEPGNCVWATRKAQNRNKRFPYNKLTLVDVKAILASGERGIDLAARYGVSKVTISAIKRRRIWKDLT